MLILLDENLLSRKLKRLIVEVGYTVYNVDNMGWRGTKDRDLLALADAHPFDVFITADKNLPYQQSISTYQLRIIVLNTKTTKPDYLVPLIEQACSYT
jgi:predicted nuclease of predicted toxin-antitoxin system